MKVVINRCFGGFGLSPLAVKEYLKRKGKECFCYDNSFSEKMKKVDVENANLFVVYSTKDLGEEITWEDLERDSGVNAGYLSRTNHMTVEVFLNFCKNLSVTPNDLVYHNYKNDELDDEISKLKEKIRELELKKEVQDE